MSFWNTFRWLVLREMHAILAHRWLWMGLVAAFLGGGLLSVYVSSDAQLWVVFQILYYFLPLGVILAAVLIVRQDLAEGPLLAMIPSATSARVLGKATASSLYSLGGLALFLAPVAVVGGEWKAMTAVFAGSAMIVLVFSSLGVMIGLRSRLEVRAYLAGFATWCLLLVGSGLVAYIGTLSLKSEYTPWVTLAALMMNPLESFRIFVFFGLNAVPMNPQSLNAIAVWWLEHPLGWLGILCAGYLVPSLWLAGRKLRYRAHHEGA